MQLKLNGETREVPDGATVAALLAHLGVKIQRVAVEVNEAVAESCHARSRAFPR